MVRWKALCLYFSKLIDFLKSTNGARRNVGFSEPSGENKKRKKTSLHKKPKKQQIEVGGPQGPEPTRYGDWEKKGRCIDF